MYDPRPRRSPSRPVAGRPRPVIAAALIARAEPAALARTRRHWRHAVRHRDTAAATARADAGTAAVTRESWLGLVRTAAAEEDEHLAREAIAVAAGMI